METLSQSWLCFRGNAIVWWDNTSEKRKRDIIYAAVFTIVCILLGGGIAEGAFMALIANVGLWFMLSEVSGWLEFLSRWGIWADLMITLLAGWMMGGTKAALYFMLFFGIYFTLCRRIFVDGIVVVVENTPVLESYEATPETAPAITCKEVPNGSTA